MKLYEGKVVSEDIKIGIVAARFNEFIVSKLVSGAQDALVRHGADNRRDRNPSAHAQQPKDCNAP